MRPEAPTPQGASRRVVEESVITSLADGTTTIRFPSDHVLGFRPTPDTGGEAVEYVSSAIESLHKFEATAKRNNGLTPTEHKTLLEELSTLESNLEGFSDVIDKNGALLYAPPPAQGPTEAMLDSEIRSALRSASESQRGDLYHTIANDPRVCLAVARSPIPMERYSQVASHIWRATVEKEQAPKVQAFQRKRESVDWARSILNVSKEIAKALPVIGRK